MESTFFGLTSAQWEWLTLAYATLSGKELPPLDYSTPEAFYRSSRERRAELLHWADRTLTPIPSI